MHLVYNNIVGLGTCSILGIWNFSSSCNKGLLGGNPSWLPIILSLILQCFIPLASSSWSPWFSVLKGVISLHIDKSLCITTDLPHQESASNLTSQRSVLCNAPNNKQMTPLIKAQLTKEKKCSTQIRRIQASETREPQAHAFQKQRKPPCMKSDLES